MTGVGGDLKAAVFWDSSLFPHLIQQPQTTLIIYQERPAAERCSTFYIFYRAYDLFLSPQAVSHADSLRCIDRCAGIRSCPGPNGQKQICLCLFCKTDHLYNFIVCQHHDPFCLGHAMQADPVFIHGLQ